MSLSSLFPDVQRQLLSLQSDFGRYESGTDCSPALAASIEHRCQSLQAACTDLDRLALSEGARRDLWRQRIRAIIDECQSLASSFHRIHASRANSENERAIRAELMSLSSGSSTERRERASTLSSLSREHTSLLQSSRLLDELTDQGRHALTAMKRQRAAIKGFHRKALDIGNSLGLSGSVLKLIERTETFNAILVAAGCVLTLTVVILIWYFLLRNR